MRAARVTLVPVLAALLGAGAPAAEPEILVSRQLLESKSLAVGDVVLLSAARSGDGASAYRIVGVFEPTPDPMRLTASRHEVRLHLPDLLELTADRRDPLGRESVAKINVALHDPADTESFATAVVERLPALNAAPAEPGESEARTFVVLKRFHLAVAMVAVAGSTAFLLALMVMRVEERRETVGILRLVGLAKARILLEVLVEGLVIAVVGAAFGVVFAALMQHAFNAFFQWKYDTALVFVRLTPGIATRCVALSVPLGVLAGLVASWTLLRRDIAALLRR